MATHITLLPHHLNMLLDTLPADFTKRANLTMSTSGSPLSDQLAERAFSSLATKVVDNRGSNEVGGISWRRASLCDSFAPVCPGTEVEVVDESGRPLRSGEPSWE